MRIVADENIPLIDQFFGDFGDIIRVPGRTMTAADVADADLLLVRSVTQVNKALLTGSKVKFVGTATIGTDHIDLDYLKDAGIGFASSLHEVNKIFGIRMKLYFIFHCFNFFA